MNELKLPGLNKNKINETQTFVEKKVTFKQTRDNFELFKRLPFQTDLDENKVAEMKESYIKNQEYFHFKNKIVIAVVSNNFDDNYNLYGGSKQKNVSDNLKELKNSNNYDDEYLQDIDNNEKKMSKYLDYDKKNHYHIQ